MDNLKSAFDLAKRRYDSGACPLDAIRQVGIVALGMLHGVPKRDFGVTAGKPYAILEDSGARTRPILPSLMLSANEFPGAWDAMMKSANPDLHRFGVSELEASKVVYSTIMSFALCFDLWKPRSRKTPGTFLEIVLGSLLSSLAPEAVRSKFISLRGAKAIVDMPQDEIVEQEEVDDALSYELAENDEASTANSVSTDIVLEFGQGSDRKGIVVPAKITTRERIVQPFAHQRILDNAFGVGRYVSLLACVSETQRDDQRERVNEICVPGTIELFQRHLAEIRGVYYLDPPDRYLRLSSSGIIQVHSIGSLLTGAFHEAITQLRIAQPG